MMMVDHDDVYGPCSSPSLIMKDDPLLTDLNTPDIDESFLASFDEEDTKEWLQREEGVDSGAKQALASSCYVDDQISVPSPPMLLTGKSSQLPEKAVECHEKYLSVDRATNGCSLRGALGTISKQTSKRDLAPDLRAVDDKELNQFLSGKHAKRGRPMKITSRSKQALYAREYRRKNKIALWNYEKKVEEQNQEIAELMKQNEEMRKSLAEMTRQFNLMKRLVATSPAMSRQLQELFGDV